MIADLTQFAGGLLCAAEKWTMLSLKRFFDFGCLPFYDRKILDALNIDWLGERIARVIALGAFENKKYIFCFFFFFGN